MKNRSLPVLLFILILTIGGYASGGLKAVANSAIAAITSGTIDGAVIGGTTPAAITGTTITATTAFVAGSNTDAYIKRYAAKQVSITGDGTGATTNAGWILGYEGTNSGYSAMWSSTITPTVANYALRVSSGDTAINAPGAGGTVYGMVNNATIFSLASTGLTMAAGKTIAANDITQTAKTTNYNNAATAGWGIPAIYGANRATAQTAANSSIATYTVGAADGSFIISGNVLVTTSTTHSFSLECAYTDEGGTARVVTFNVQQLGGTLITAITNVTGAGPYEGVPLHIRAKASTAITIRTNSGGTYTTVTYNAEGVIQQIQ